MSDHDHWDDAVKYGMYWGVPVLHKDRMLLLDLRMTEEELVGLNTEAIDTALAWLGEHDVVLQLDGAYDIPHVKRYVFSKLGLPDRSYGNDLKYGKHRVVLASTRDERNFLGYHENHLFYVGESDDYGRVPDKEIRWVDVTMWREAGFTLADLYTWEAAYTSPLVALHSLRMAGLIPTPSP